MLLFRTFKVPLISKIKDRHKDSIFLYFISSV